jgi:outer membrane biosynthesis protein TonB
MRRRLRRRPHISPALLGAIGAAAVSFGVCFAVVADATRTSPPERVAVQPARQAVHTRLALAPAPTLRVRASLLPAAPSAPVQAASEPPKQATPPPETQTQTQQTTTTTQTTPTPTPKPKPKPKPKSKPKPKPTGPDFDDTGPNPG